MTFLIILAFLGWLLAGMCLVQVRAMRDKVSERDTTIWALRAEIERLEGGLQSDADIRHGEQFHLILESQQTIAQALTLVSKAVEAETEKIRLDARTGMSMLSAEVQKNAGANVPRAASSRNGPGPSPKPRRSPKPPKVGDTRPVEATPFA